jgi:U3 small nucleolar RNA-associated protein 4
MDIHLGTKVRKIVGNDESEGEWISLDQERSRNPEDDEAYEYDEAFAATNQSALARLRREDGTAVEPGTPQKSSKGKLTGGVNGVANTPKKQLVVANGTASQPPRRWWHTYKYRDILGIVPLGGGSGDVLEEEDQSPSGILEVAVVERPMWDVELPGRYLRDYE